MHTQQLVKDCLRGRAAAQRQLYELFAEEMYAVCYRYTKSVRDAEDVLQDGFVKVFTALHQFNFEGPLGAWIRRIMVNTALNFLKKNQKYRNEMYFAETPLHPVADNNPEMELDTRELANLIRQLPPGYQAIFNLHAIEGYTHVEIGQLLGISDGTSRSQYARARSLLISWIEDHSLHAKKVKYAGK